MRRKWSTVSVHRPYMAKLEQLKTVHKRSFSNIVELLIDRALADPALVTPIEAPERSEDHDGPQDPGSAGDTQAAA